MQKSNLAFLFPGQGSQKIGMLSDLASIYPVVKETFDEASEVLSYDMWRLVQSGESAEINLTERTQPILLTASVALWRLWCEQSHVRPSWMAGHSLGEFSALVCAGSLAFSDAVALVRLRGRAMQEAVPVGVGAMAAVIGLDDDQVEAACHSVHSGVVEAVNFNSPGQLVIAGEVAAVNEAIEVCKGLGAKKGILLPVSAPFHTSLMVPAAEKLAEALADISIVSPSVPVVHNVHAQPLSAPEDIRQILVRQIHSPVRWVACVKYMAANAVVDMVECGPGKVLGGLNKRIDKSLVNYALEDVQSFDVARDGLSI